MHKGNFSILYFAIFRHFKITLAVKVHNIRAFRVCPLFAMPKKILATALVLKIVVFKDFVKFTRKHVCWSLFLRVFKRILQIFKNTYAELLLPEVYFSGNLLLFWVLEFTGAWPWRRPEFVFPCLCPQFVFTGHGLVD